jgi:hypothetical protein
MISHIGDWHIRTVKDQVWAPEENILLFRSPHIYRDSVQGIENRADTSVIGPFSDFRSRVCRVSFGGQYAQCLVDVDEFLVLSTCESLEQYLQASSIHSLRLSRPGQWTFRGSSHCSLHRLCTPGVAANPHKSKSITV